MPVLRPDSESTQNYASLWSLVTIFDVFILIYAQKYVQGQKQDFAICEQQNAVQKIRDHHAKIQVKQYLGSNARMFFCIFIIHEVRLSLIHI